MNRSYSKLRHIKESNRILEKSLLKESIFFKGNSNWDDSVKRKRRSIIDRREEDKDSKNSVHDLSNYFYDVDYDELNSDDEKDHILYAYDEYKDKDLDVLDVERQEREDYWKKDGNFNRDLYNKVLRAKSITEEDINIIVKNILNRKNYD